MANLHNAEQVLEQERKHEFAKFTIKTTMTAQQIKDAVMEEEYEYVKGNDDILWDFVVERHVNENISDELYLEMYMDNVHVQDEDDALRDQLYKEITNE